MHLEDLGLLPRSFPAKILSQRHCSQKGQQQSKLFKFLISSNFLYNSRLRAIVEASPDLLTKRDEATGKPFTLFLSVYVFSVLGNTCLHMAMYVLT